MGGGRRRGSAVLFEALKPYAPPPPPGAQPLPRWGDEAHVRDLLGDRVEVVRAERRTVPVGHFAGGEEVRDYFRARYGPTIAVYRNLAGEPERADALDRGLAELGRRLDAGGGAMEWEYLLLIARRV